MRANRIRILTNNIQEIFKNRLAAARKQFTSKLIEVKLHKKIHDRYFILDQKEIWSIGTSYNETTGNKPTTIQPVKDDKENIIINYNAMWEESNLII